MTESNKIPNAGIPAPINIYSHSDDYNVVPLPAVGQLQPVVVNDRTPTGALFKKSEGTKTGPNLTLWSPKSFSVEIDGTFFPAEAYKHGTAVVYLGLNDKENFPDLARLALKIHTVEDRQTIWISTQEDMGPHQSWINLKEPTPLEKFVGHLAKENRPRRTHPRSLSVPIDLPWVMEHNPPLTVKGGKGRNVTVKLENYDQGRKGSALHVSSPDPFLIWRTAITAEHKGFGIRGEVYSANIDLEDEKKFPDQNNVAFIIVPSTDNQKFFFQTLTRPDF